MFEITLSGPGKNALGSALMTEVTAKVAEAGGRPILLTGAGDAFSAGLNLREVASLDVAGMERFLRKLEEMTNALFTYPAPIVALVNGHAIAGGCIVAMACDWRVAPAGTKLKMGLNEVAIGLRFPPGILRLVRRRVDVRCIEEVVLGAQLHDGPAALRLGLLDELAPDAERARAAAEAKLTALAALPADAYAAAKHELRGTLAISPDEDLRFVRDVLPTWTSPELKARLAQVLAR